MQGARNGAIPESVVLSIIVGICEIGTYTYIYTIIKLYIIQGASSLRSLSPCMYVEVFEWLLCTVLYQGP